MVLSMGKCVRNKEDKVRVRERERGEKGVGDSRWERDREMNGKT
jgi:hypothetical protein